MRCLNCDTDLKNRQKKFCTRSCAASFNNKLFPKRQPEHDCLTCGSKVISSKRYCNEKCRKARPKKSSKPRESNKVAVSNRRRLVKAILVEEAGGKCVDCGFTGPPFMFDFDHRDPNEKSFPLSGNTSALVKMREEAKKCDLVCPTCHRMRTHIQRCPGCDDCI